MATVEALLTGEDAVVPEVIFEMRSPTDRWPGVLKRVAQDLNAGTQAVCIRDEQTRTLTVCRSDGPPLVLKTTDELSLPEVYEDVRVPVTRFFE